MTQRRRPASRLPASRPGFRLSRPRGPGAPRSPRAHLREPAPRSRPLPARPPALRRQRGRRSEGLWPGKLRHAPARPGRPPPPRPRAAPAQSESLTPPGPSAWKRGEMPLREGPFGSCLWWRPLCRPEAVSFITLHKVDARLFLSHFSPEESLSGQLREFKSEE